MFAIINSGLNVNKSGFTANTFVCLIEYKHIPTILFILSGRTANNFLSVNEKQKTMSTQILKSLIMIIRLFILN